MGGRKVHTALHSTKGSVRGTANFKEEEGGRGITENTQRKRIKSKFTKSCNSPTFPLVNFISSITDWYNATYAYI